MIEDSESKKTYLLILLTALPAESNTLQAAT
jgi:hypothetical protein